MRQLIEFGDRKFSLYRIINETDKIDANLLKEFWHCDTVLKKDNKLYFCNEIKEIDYAEIGNESTTTN